MKKYICLFIVLGFNAFGTWLTFLAIALQTKHDFGVQAISYNFLIQSLPALLLGPFINKFIKHKNKLKSYIFLQFLLAFLVLSLTLISSKYYLYFYLIASSVINAFIIPILMQYFSEVVESSKMSQFQIRYASINGAMLFLAPSLGGFLSSSFGFKFLYILDSITFFISAVSIAFVHHFYFKSQSKFESYSFSQHRESEKKSTVLQSFRVIDMIFKRPELNFTKELKNSLFAWYALLLFGALLNATEFIVFDSAQLKQEQIGLVLGAWGVGQLISLVFGKRLENILNFNYVMVLSILLFALGPHFYTMLICFCLGGYATAIVTGELRSQIISQIQAPMTTLEISTLMQSRLALINLSVYGVLSTFVNLKQFLTLILCLVLVSAVYLFFSRISKQNNRAAQI